MRSLKPLFIEPEMVCSIVVVLSVKVRREINNNYSTLEVFTPLLDSMYSLVRHHHRGTHKVNVCVMW